MILEKMKFLNRDKYKGFKVYAHNFAWFDSIFLLAILAKNRKTKC